MTASTGNAAVKNVLVSTIRSLQASEPDQNRPASCLPLCLQITIRSKGEMETMQDACH